ncbi:hypothetical protein Mal33_54600 [Rosistilla oblonga]|uniref:Uncharacterized protein n=1 Tax=Rosistilla oblonga TaxID=2527990 RepID=A0A518J255_9BACT|nr:hypothetical protein Mal33_54600 [Rosistilla oblonga]
MVEVEGATKLGQLPLLSRIVMFVASLSLSVIGLTVSNLRSGATGSGKRIGLGASNPVDRHSLTTAPPGCGGGFCKSLQQLEPLAAGSVGCERGMGWGGA